MKKRYLKLVLFALLDFILGAVSVFFTFALLGESFTGDAFLGFAMSVLIFPTILFIVIYTFRGYITLWKFAGFNDYVRMGIGCFISVAAFFVTHRAFNIRSFEGSIPFAAFVLFVFSCALICTVRLIMRKLSRMADIPTDEESLAGNIMVIGAGSAGCAIINDIEISKQLAMSRIKCVIDDDVDKKGQYICGAKIVGGYEEIIPAAEKYDIDIIVFAIPSCSSERKSAILKICQKTDCKIKVIPSVYQMLSEEEVNVSSLRKVEIEDLLGRDPVSMNIGSIMSYVENKVIMVTGGGGSIGSELCRQIAAHKPLKLIIFDIYENNAYDIQNELKKAYPELELITLIGSVRDTRRLEGVFEKYRPQIIYHAAAHKHVPLMEDSPNESIKNNVFGTANTARCADKYGTEKFVLISTDKAVNPTNIMGASKRICEMIVQSFNNHSDTEFVAVRFGNVLGSNGSVIPLFKKQIEQGGPVTVTDPNIIRYFMTIPEAVSLVLQAGATAKGGEIFVLDMGEPVKILDLAENLIRLSGYKPYTDIRIEFTGLRPGEKLYEEILMSEEGLKETENRLIRIGHPIDIDEELLASTLKEMSAVMGEDGCDIRALVKKIVPTYTYVIPKPGEHVKA